MAENKTKATRNSPAAYVAGIPDAARRADCEALLALMARASGETPVMWGTAIVGYGVHRYALAGGRQGEICTVGFSSRKDAISLYGIAGEHADRDLLSRLGRHRLGKGCLYVSRLTDIDAGVLAELVADAMLARRARDGVPEG